MNDWSSENDRQLSGLLQLIKTTGHEHWWLKPSLSAVFERSGYYLVPHHYYAPLPTPAQINNSDYDLDKFPLPKQSLPADDELKLGLEGALDYVDEFREMIRSGEFSNDNNFYSNLDAFYYYATIRRYKPGQIVEIGSGYSTKIALAALSMNGSGSITCIEPNVTPVLRGLSGNLRIIESDVQSVGLSIWEELSRNDICFIDSSHVARLDSDVLLEVFKILPALARGVRVHFHDIFIPYEYPPFWVKDRRWFWNEQYLLYALLVGDAGHRYTVDLPVQWLARRKEPAVLRAAASLPPLIASGSSFWMTVK